MLANLSVKDFAERFRSPLTNEWVYVFKPRLAGTILYVKLGLRKDAL